MTTKRSHVVPKVSTDPAAPDVMKASDAAKYLCVSEAWLRQSDVPRARFGARIVFLRSELLAYAEAHLTHRVNGGAA